jgi:hypothetical protein
MMLHDVRNGVCLARDPIAERVFVSCCVFILHRCHCS